MTARFASITSSLLVRKGEAAPSVRSPSSPASAPAALPAPVSTPADRPSPPTAQTEPAVVRTCASGRGGLSSDNAACQLPESERGLRASVRLDPVEARRLRLAAVLLDRTHQDLISAALDQYLDRLSRRELKDCACFRQIGE